MMHLKYNLYSFLFFLIIGLLGISQNLIGQDSKQTSLKNKIDRTKKLSTIHLKNGTTIHGKVVTNNQDSLQIRLLSKNQLTFHKDNIQNIEELSSIKTKNKYILIEAGYVIGGPSYQQNAFDRGYTLQLAVGYTFLKHLSTGIGIGFNRYNHGNFRPIYLDLRGDIFNTPKVGLTYYGNFGYGFLTKKKRPTLTPISKRGLFYAYGIGLKLIGANKKPMIISIGNQSQYFAWYDDYLYVYELIWYNRLVIKLSLIFN